MLGVELNLCEFVKKTLNRLDFASEFFYYEVENADRGKQQDRLNCKHRNKLRPGGSTRMRFVVIEFCYKNCSTGSLPENKGSMLRGGFGHALKSVACHNFSCSICDDCHSRENCLFYQIFSAEDRQLPQQKDIPRPYVFRSECLETDYSEVGKPLRVEMVVFEHLTCFLPQIIQAMEEAGKNGFGIQRVSFLLSRIRVRNAREDFIDYKSEDWRAKYINPIDLVPSFDSAQDKFVSGLFEIYTPLYLKEKKTGKCLLDGKNFLKAIVRRVSSVSRCWGNNDWAKINFKRLFDSFDGCVIVQKDLKWKAFSRYSCSQKGQFPVCGFVGHFVLQNIPVSLLKTLAILDDLHLGKGAAWGQGRVKTIGFF